MGPLNCCEIKKQKVEEINNELNSEREQSKPQLICFYESGNEEQKNYCIKLKDNFKHEKTINYDIQSIPKVPFSIKIAYNNNIIDLQKVFDDSDETMNETLKKAYEFLKKND